MTPISVAYVRGSSGKIRLEGKCREIDKGVAGETDLVTMTAQSTPTVEYQRAKLRTIFYHIIEKYMITPERLSEAICKRACEMLLPVEPPEIYSFAFMVSENSACKGFGKVCIVEYPRNIVAVAIFSVEGGVHLREIFRRF